MRDPSGVEVTIEWAGSDSSVYPGGTLAGQVRVVVPANKAPCVARSLRLRVQGRAVVRWYGTRDYVIMSVSKLYRDTAVLLHPPGNEDAAHLLEEGAHTFPFSFLVPPPSLIPPSFDGLDSCNTAAAGHIRYYAKAILDQGLNLPKLQKREIFTVKPLVDPTSPALCLPQPRVESSAVMSYYGSKNGEGRVELTAHIAKRGWPVGDTIPVDVTVKVSPGQAIPIKEATVRLHRVIKCQVQTSNYSMKFRASCVNISELTGNLAGGSELMAQVDLPIPSTLHPSLSNCNIIAIEYFVRVKLTRGLFKKLHIDIPVTLCTRPGCFEVRPDTWPALDIYEPPDYSTATVQLESEEEPPTYAYAVAESQSLLAIHSRLDRWMTLAS
eukprot:jgi/Chlat1/6345/Chrsp44S05907